jgi:Gluconate 2-dehydrogenase subunit 3
MSDANFDDRERAALRALLDTLVPPGADGRMPGAGELGLAETIEEKLGALRPLVGRGLAELDERARARGGESFAALAPDERAAVVAEHSAGDPAFVPGLLFQAYVHYYQHDRVVAALGLEPRPPHPLGYALAQPDLDALLAPVRAGPKRYREA